MWYHRGCASVSQKLLQELTTSEEPFLCLMCSRAAFKEEVSRLKSEIVSLKNELTMLPSLQSSTEALHREIKDLQRNVGKLLSEPKTSVSKNPSKSYASITAAGPKAQHSDSQVAHKNHQAKEPSHSNSPLSSRQNSSSKEKVLVLGARRIWGTLKACPSSIIQSTISKLTSVKDDLQVKRKFKKLPGGKTTWWFVIHTHEYILCKLDEEWEKVKMQTGWALQHCYMPAVTSAHPPSGSKSNSLLPSTNSPSPSPDLPSANAFISLETQESVSQHDNSTAPIVPAPAPLESSSSTSPSTPGQTPDNDIENPTPFLDPVPPHPPPPLQV